VSSEAVTERTIGVLVVDDHPVVAEGVAALVHQAPWIRVLGSAPSGREAIAEAARLRPDVALVDLCLPDMLGSEVVAALVAGGRHTDGGSTEPSGGRRRGRALPGPGRPAVVVFTAFPDHAGIEAARQAGAVGVVLKDAGRTDLITTVTRAARGEHLGWSASGERAVSPTDLRRVGLTRREYDVVRHVALGETNREIAGAMYLSPNTVKTYLQSALVKLGARNRVEAIARAHEHGLL
jgi:two-component system nitrate/nitrite response regulator NarL